MLIHIFIFNAGVEKHRRLWKKQTIFEWLLLTVILGSLLTPWKHNFIIYKMGKHSSQRVVRIKLNKLKYKHVNTLFDMQ